MTSVRTLPLWSTQTRIFIAVFALSLLLALNPMRAHAAINLSPVGGSAIVDASTLVPTFDTTPTLHGTALNVAQVKVALSNNKGTIWTSNLLSVVNGKWSVDVPKALALGQYTVVVYAYNNYMLGSGSYVTVVEGGKVKGAATTLTSAQIQAVTGLLHSFNVDTETIGAVEAQLNGTANLSEEGDSDRPNHSSSITLARTSSSTSDMPRPPKPDTSSFNSTNNSHSSADKPRPTAALCGQLMRSLRPGDEGSDVSSLQEFLGRVGDLHASSTGFFGPMTQEALAQFQARMNLASSSNNGAGSLGPRTRELIMRLCKEGQGFDHPGSSASSSNGLNSAPAPTCVLSADKTTITSGESVIVTWTSQNATLASSVTGMKGPPQGSITLSPAQTTSYVKKVYGPGGEGHCALTITVTNTTPASEPKVVIVSPSVNVANVVVAVGQGLAIVGDAYLSLFRWQQ